MQEINADNFDTTKQAALDDTLLVKFFTKQRADAAASDAAGRPIFKDVIYIDIKIPGSNTGGACRPARPGDIARFPRHYAAFKQRMEMPESGTPLSEWPQVTRSLAEELAFYNVKTVEQLANMADVNVSNFMGLAGFKQKAVEWLELVNDQKQADDLQRELSKRDKEIDELRMQIENLMTKPETIPETDVPHETPEAESAVKPKARRRRKKKAA